MHSIFLFFRYVVPKPRAQCTKGEQLAVTFAAGYIAGVFCAIVSHPADTVVSKLNQAKGASALDVAKKLGWAGKKHISLLFSVTQIANTLDLKHSIQVL